MHDGILFSHILKVLVKAWRQLEKLWRESAKTNEVTFFRNILKQNFKCNSGHHVGEIRYWTEDKFSSETSNEMVNQQDTEMYRYLRQEVLQSSLCENYIAIYFYTFWIKLTSGLLIQTHK